MALVAFPFPGAWGVSVPFWATLMGPFFFPTAFALFMVVSPPSVIGGSRVVRDSGFGGGVNEFLDLELGVALEAFVGEQLHHFVEGKRPIDVSFRAGSVNGVNAHSLWLRYRGTNRCVVPRWVGGEGIVVGHLRDDLLKQVNVLSDVGPVNVSEVLYGVA